MLVAGIQQLPIHIEIHAGLLVRISGMPVKAVGMPLSIVYRLRKRLKVSNAIKLIENALKEARQGAFRVRNCHDFEKMCMPNRRRRSA